MVEPHIYSTVKIGSTYFIGTGQALSVELTLTDDSGVVVDGVNDLRVSASQSNILGYGTDTNGLFVQGFASGEGLLILTDPVTDSSSTEILFSVLEGDNAFSASFISDTGLEISIEHLAISDGGSTWDYDITYTQYNPTAGALDESQWRAFTVDGDSEPQYGFCGKLYPDDTIRRVYQYRFLKDNPVVMLQFHSDAFFDSVPKEDGVIWYLNPNVIESLP